MKHSEKARALFESGYNCSQSVFAAFCDITGLCEKQALQISVGLGGGVGRLREVCGAVSGAAMVLGYVYGGEDGKDKLSAYEKVQQFAREFEKQNGSIICRALLHLDQNEKPSFKPEERTERYYKKRPCADLVEISAEILEKILNSDK